MPGIFHQQRLLLLALFVFLLPSQLVWSQKKESSPNLPDSVLKLYKNDADRLALRFAHATKTSYKDSIRIDSKQSEYYLKALLAVYNANQLPARDTVVKFLKIHTYNPGMNSIVLRGQSNLVWMDNLKNNRFPTGNPDMDRLITKYHLKKTFYSSLFQPHLLVLSSASNYNLDALACALEMVYGASAIQPEFLYGDGNDIFDTLRGGNLELTYAYGWDNCANTCKSKRYWKFRVQGEQVDYLGSWGQTLEPGLEMTALSGETFFSNVKLYPNPAKDQLYVEITGAESLPFKLNIVNHNGDLVFARTHLYAGEIIDLSHLLMGKYKLSIVTDGQEKVFNLQKNFNPRVGE